jgi:Pyruvate-formate lyase-activating enzyme
MISARVFGISRHRIATDGEGVTTLVAFSGCPLRCKYCLNPQSWNEANGQGFSAESLYEILKMDQLYFLATNGGVTFGGGEPMLQVDFIEEFRTLCGPLWNITLETSLNVPRENVRRLDKMVDHYFVDIKDLNAEIYQNYTCKQNDLVISNLKFLLSGGNADRIIVRVPHIPDFNTDEDISKSISLLREMGVTQINEFQYLLSEKLQKVKNDERQTNL